MECKNCEHMARTCAVESLYAIGQLKSCPFINEPVLNEYGWLMNPPFTEKYQLSTGHIFIIPEKAGQLWVINWIITKNGAGTCGRTGEDIFIQGYKKAIDCICGDPRLKDQDRKELLEIFENKFDNRRTFLPKIAAKPEEVIVKEEYVSPFENMVMGPIGDQLELF